MYSKYYQFGGLLDVLPSVQTLFESAGILRTPQDVTPVAPLPPRQIKPLAQPRPKMPFQIPKQRDFNIYDEINDTLKNRMPGLGLLGAAGTYMANAPGFKPDVGLGAIGGAMQGAQTFGIPGALVGAGFGALSAAKKRSDYETMAEDFQKQRIKGKTISGNLGYYAQFGGETPGAVPSQTEVGEIVLFPDNTLPNVKAKKRHKNMDPDEVTDMLPEGSYVFSDDPNMKFDAGKLKDKVLAYGISYYDEHGQYDTETMQMGGMMPESGKMTFAQAASHLRSRIPTTGNKKDILDIVTDSDNLETRVPYLMELINLQDTKNASEGRADSTAAPPNPLEAMEQPMPPAAKFGGSFMGPILAYQMGGMQPMGMGQEMMQQAPPQMQPGQMPQEAMMQEGEAMPQEMPQEEMEQVQEMPQEEMPQEDMEMPQGEDTSTDEGDGEDPNKIFRKDLQNPKLLERTWNLIEKHKIKDPFMRSLMFAESKGDPNAISRTNNIGLFQIGAGVVEDWNTYAKNEPGFKKLKADKKTLKDAATNVMLAEWYFKKRLPAIMKAKGIPETMSFKAAAFNMGPGALAKVIDKYPRGKNEKMENYVRKIQSHLNPETKSYIDRLWIANEHFSKPKPDFTQTKAPAAKKPAKKQYGSKWTIIEDDDEPQAMQSGGLTGQESAWPSPKFTFGATLPEVTVTATKPEKSKYSKDKMSFFQNRYKLLLDAAQKRNVKNPQVLATVGAAMNSLESGFRNNATTPFGVKWHEGRHPDDKKFNNSKAYLQTSEYEEDGVKRPQMSWFRTYPDMQAAAGDYLDFIINNKSDRYQPFLNANTVADAIYAIQKSGYSTSPIYGESLSKIVNAMYNR